VTAALEGSECAVDEVFIGRVLVWDLEADDMRFMSMGAVVALFLGYRFAGTVVVCCETELVLVFGKGVEALGGTEATVGVA
jgi:hypothetical protein